MNSMEYTQKQLFVKKYQNTYKYIIDLHSTVIPYLLSLKPINTFILLFIFIYKLE